MSLRDLLPLGQPPPDDVDAAARLWLQYQQVGISEDGARMFWRSLNNPDEVERRAAELAGSSAA
jgi:hypothetical protein